MFLTTGKLFYRIIRHNHGTRPEITIISSERDSNNETVVSSEQAAESKCQPVWHLLVLSTATLSIYLVYWAYKTWRDLAAQAADENRLAEHPALQLFKGISPKLRTLALAMPFGIWFIPLLDPWIKEVLCNGIEIYVLGTLVLGVASLNPDPKSFSRQHPLLACFFVLASYLALLTLAQLSGVAFLLSMLSTVPFGYVQHWLNRYWRAVEPAGLHVRQAFNMWEMLAIVIGTCLIGLVAAGTMIGVSSH